MSGPQKPDEKRSSFEELSPGLRDAIGATLNRPMPDDLPRRALEGVRSRVAQKAPRPRRRAALWAILAAAASIGMVALYWQTPELRPVNPPSRPSVQPNMATAESAGSAEDLPTAWVYRQAARQSPEALEAVLDRHARQFLPCEGESPLAGLSLVPMEGVL